MSYDYLFKYIIIGDTGSSFKFLNPNSDHLFFVVVVVVGVLVVVVVDDD